MCYSGKCRWEQHSGDCGFPQIKQVRDKFPFPVCTNNDETPEDQEKTRKITIEIEEILKNL
jgi:tRNA-dihydrouridine synthase